MYKTSKFFCAAVIFISCGGQTAKVSPAEFTSFTVFESIAGDESLSCENRMTFQNSTEISVLSSCPPQFPSSERTLRTYTTTVSEKDRDILSKALQGIRKEDMKTAYPNPDPLHADGAVYEFLFQSEMSGNVKVSMHVNTLNSLPLPLRTLFLSVLNKTLHP